MQAGQQDTSNAVSSDHIHVPSTCVASNYAHQGVCQAQRWLQRGARRVASICLTLGYKGLVTGASLRLPSSKACVWRQMQRSISLSASQRQSRLESPPRVEQRLLVQDVVDDLVHRASWHCHDGLASCLSFVSHFKHQLLKQHVAAGVLS